MGKFFLRFSLASLVILIIFIGFLTYFGLKTDKFDVLIKNKANEVNQNIKLEFKETKIYFSPFKLNIIVKLQSPKILIRENEIILSKLDLFLPLKSFFTSDFLLKKANIAFFENDIKDLTKVTKIFLPTIINNKLKKIFEKGTLEGEFSIPFDADGSVASEYGFTGKMTEANINLVKDLSINNLTTDISYLSNYEGSIFLVNFENGKLYDLDLKDSSIKLKREKKDIAIESNIKTNGKINSNQVKKILSKFNFKNNLVEEVHGSVKLITSFNFKISEKLKIKDLSYGTNGNISLLELSTKENSIVKNYLPNFKSKITIKDAKINYEKINDTHTTQIDGLAKISKTYEAFTINEKHNYSKKNSRIEGNIFLENSKFEIPKLNYVKDIGDEASLTFAVNFVKGNFLNIEKLSYLASPSEIKMANIKLNEKFEILELQDISVKTYQKNKKNNDFFIKKNKEIIIDGKTFDAEPLLKSLYQTSDKKIFNKKFSSKVKINFKKVLTGTDDDVTDFSMIAGISKGSYEKLSLKGNFSNNEIIEMSIYQLDKDKKTLQVISDRARPFMKNFKFIKGFEGGKLEYDSIISKESSDSKLIITDFRVSKVPALAKLLTLASLQGIADTLSGEGIRFDSFEMKTNSKGNTLNIEDALAMGPAVSILLDGYVDKGKVVSLRGTLVPATKLNSIIASIPLVGDILVGTKTGEGVVGVSFKMKGPPSSIKTTVNPIKTLTPRFIVRAVEKMKKKNKETTK